MLGVQVQNIWKPSTFDAQRHCVLTLQKWPVPSEIHLAIMAIVTARNFRQLVRSHQIEAANLGVDIKMIIDQGHSDHVEALVNHEPGGEGNAASGGDPCDEKALREGHLLPVCFVSAETGAGLDALLNVIIKLLPNPAEGNPPPFLRGEGEDAEPVQVAADRAAHVIAHVFKVVVDPYVGRMGVFRIHQGTVTSNTQLYIGDARKPFKVSHLYRLQGKETEEIPSAGPGDICADTKVEEIQYHSELHDSHDEDNYHLRPAALSPPMMGLTI